jgi:hypothetical protein
MRLNIGLASSKPFNQLPLSLRLRSPQGESKHHKTLKRRYFGGPGGKKTCLSGCVSCNGRLISAPTLSRWKKHSQANVVTWLKQIAPLASFPGFQAPGSMIEDWLMLYLVCVANGRSAARLLLLKDKAKRRLVRLFCCLELTLTRTHLPGFMPLSKNGMPGDRRWANSLTRTAGNRSPGFAKAGERTATVEEGPPGEGTRDSPIGTMASAHVCATIPNYLVCEWHWINHLEVWKTFVKEGEIIQQGYVTPSDKPGFGVEMNEEVAKTVQIPGTTWFEPNK